MKLQWPWVSRKKYEATERALDVALRFDGESAARWKKLASSNLRLAEQHAEAMGRYLQRLQAIAACETPSANATVRRMARIAREALGR